MFIWVNEISKPYFHKPPPAPPLLIFDNIFFRLCFLSRARAQLHARFYCRVGFQKRIVWVGICVCVYMVWVVGRHAPSESMHAGARDIAGSLFAAQY